MRLLLVNYEYPPVGGGAGNATRHIARYLAEQGVETVVLTSAFRGLPRREQLDGVTVMRVAALRRRADRSDPLEMSSFMASAAAAALRLVRRWRPDATIAFFGIPGGPIGWLLKRTHGIPYVVSLRGGDVPGFQPYELAFYHRLTSPLIRGIWRDALGVVANSHGLADLARAAAPGAEVSVIPNGVDSETFVPATGDGRDTHGERPFRLLFVGRLTHQKGLDVLLEALSLCERDFHLTVVGDGPERGALETGAPARGLAGRVAFAGWATRDRLPELYRAADALVLPSRDEGMPNVVLEAMAAGLPVVATAVPGTAEVVAHGETGLLVERDGAAALARALDQLASDRALAAAMGRSGRARAERDFGWDRVARSYLALIRERTDGADPFDDRAS